MIGENLRAKPPIITAIIFVIILAAEGIALPEVVYWWMDAVLLLLAIHPLIYMWPKRGSKIKILADQKQAQPNELVLKAKSLL